MGALSKNNKRTLCTFRNLNAPSSTFLAPKNHQNRMQQAFQWRLLISHALFTLLGNHWCRLRVGLGGGSGAASPQIRQLPSPMRWNSPTALDDLQK